MDDDDDDDDVENDDPPGWKNITSKDDDDDDDGSYRVKHFRKQTKEKTRGAKKSTTALSLRAPRVTHHERLVKRVEHLF